MADDVHLPAPKLAFYADDFTGATDTLATVARAGLRAMLFMHPPTQAQRLAAGPLDCLGLAGTSRSLRAVEQTLELEAAANYLASLHAPVVHYKTCSTFDSSPHIGSIGHAVGILRKTLGAPRFLPVIGGQPNLGRYCVFGHAFAAFQTGGCAYRLDRHPTMSAHPVTPMQESDLSRHLAEQGMRQMSRIEYLRYAEAPGVLDEIVERAIVAGPDGVLFDVSEASQLPIIGRILWRHACSQPLLAVGPSSVAQALLAHWGNTADETSPVAQPAAGRAGRSGPVLVISGSLSPLTANQIEAAGTYRKIAVTVDALLRRNGMDITQAFDDIVLALKAGRDVLVHVSSPDAHTDVAAQRSSSRGVAHATAATAADTVDARALARACGALLAHVLAQVRPARVGVAGGDTSSYAVRALDVWGLSYLGQIDPGAALCRMHSDVAHLSGLEIMLKGGQMGSMGVFEKLRTGMLAPAKG